jgi:membrane protein implicated in regulation of membrane protease activity
VRPWIVYSLLRLGVFAAVFALLATYLRLPLESMGIAGFPMYLLAALVAALISFAVSYIFFARLRHAVAADLADRRERARRGEVDDDTAEEDALLDGER